MKTNHSIATLLLLLSLGMTSCSTYYRMTSRIDTNGSMHREVYARGDSAFIAGDKTHNPFLFFSIGDREIFSIYQGNIPAGFYIQFFFFSPEIKFEGGVQIYYLPIGI